MGRWWRAGDGGDERRWELRKRSPEKGAKRLGVPTPVPPTNHAPRFPSLAECCPRQHKHTHTHKHAQTHAHRGAGFHTEPRVLRWAGFVRHTFPKDARSRHPQQRTETAHGSASHATPPPLTCKRHRQTWHGRRSRSGGARGLGGRRAAATTTDGQAFCVR